MAYLICAFLGSGVLAAICIPLFRKDNSLESAIIEETEWDLLQRQKEILLGNIQDLDFEFKCGKLSDTDYKQVRGEMTSEIAVVLEHIDQLEKSLDLDVLIRRETDARKGPAKSKAQTFCGTCGAKNPPSNRFCSECGTKLNRS
jgi:ribosomal protein L40E